MILEAVIKKLEWEEEAIQINEEYLMSQKVGLKKNKKNNKVMFNSYMLGHDIRIYG